MNIILVDDEKAALNALRRSLKDMVNEENINEFLYADEALSFAKENVVDIAFLDIEMSEMNGLFLAKHLKDINGETNIIFVTGYSDYALDAFSVNASGYVMKPINPDSVKKELENLRFPVKTGEKVVYVRCFGNFEIFVEGKPVKFNRPKAKEAIAYLVDRKGANVSKKMLAAILWEDSEYTRSLQSHLHKLIEEIERALKEVNAIETFRKSNGFYSVDTTKFSCDYYDYENGKTDTFKGEYLSEYSWAEPTAAFLVTRPTK